MHERSPRALSYDLAMDFLLHSLKGRPVRLLKRNKSTEAVLYSGAIRPGELTAELSADR